MPQGYSKELLEQYMKEEQNENKKKQDREQKAAKKNASEMEKTRRIAQLALEEVQKSRVEIENLQRTVKRNKTITIIAIVISIICMAMVMGGELAAMTNMLP